MEVLQYIYTSWKNGDSTEKGYMIYSKSQGITEAECIAIKDAMQYVAPKELNLAPTAEEIAEVFPYAFSYFILPTGRGCVANSTYLGRDYSGRFGNYIIYAMVFDKDELTCRPSEFFGEEYIKTAMTDEELSAPSPVPPLPALSIDQYGSVINDDQLNEFIYDKEDEFAHVISMMLKARDLGVPFYLNDTRENLVLWASAIQRVLPFSIAKKFTFNTYMFDQEIMRSARVKEEGLDFCLIGVRPDANYFSYATECKSSRHLVMDFLGGYMSEGIEPLAYATAMASSLTLDFEEIESFAEFIDSTSFNDINGKLEDAYLYYRLLKNNEYEHTEDNLKAVLNFGISYCSDMDNADISSKLLMSLQESNSTIGLDMIKTLWGFVSKYSSYMMFTLFDLVQATIFRNANQSSEACAALDTLLNEIREEMPQEYREFVNYFNSSQSVDSLSSDLYGNDSVYCNEFFIRLIFDNYNLQDLLLNSQPISKLLVTLLNNISRIDNCEKIIVKILIDASASRTTFDSVLKLFKNSVQDSKRAELICICYVDIMNDLTETQTGRFEQMLLETPEAYMLSNQLFARKIIASKKPEDEFWRFYNQYGIRRVDDPNFSLDPLITACLNKLDADQRRDAAIEMIRRIDSKLFREEITIRILTDIVNGCSFKTLTKLDAIVLHRACDLRNKIDAKGFDKIKLILIGQNLDGFYSQNRRPSSLSVELSDPSLTLAGFDKSDYEAYTKKYFSAFFSLISSKEDVSLLMNLFYNKQFFGDFISDYVSAIKKMEKKEQTRWVRILTWTCVFLVSAPNGDSAADALYKPVISYMRSVDDDSLMEIRQEMVRDVPRAQCDQFLDEVNRKETFSDKFKNLFHKK